LAHPPWRRQLDALLAGPEDDLGLAEAALLIACGEYPGLSVPVYLGRLDSMAETFRARLGAEASSGAAAAALKRFVFEEEGFEGNTTEYEDPRNSYLNEVLDRRTGIPITLCLVAVEVARRAGVPAEGVGLPGHFIARIGRAPDATLIDPFHGGIELTEEDCQGRLDRIFAGQVRLEPEMLVAWSPRRMLSRILRNLKHVYVKSLDAERALATVDLLVSVEPDDPEEVRDRGLLYASLDCYSLALRDLESYVTLASPPLDSEEILARIADLRHKAARVS
jgi:regulator of sirC expression with transglutaminase-like and TPR domain